MNDAVTSIRSTVTESEWEQRVALAACYRLVARLGWAPVPASVVGYCVAVPASFLGHRRFSFRSNGHWTAEAVRFVLAQAVNMTVTAGSMHAALRWRGSSYVWGMVAAVILAVSRAIGETMVVYIAGGAAGNQAFETNPLEPGLDAACSPSRRRPART